MFRKILGNIMMMLGMFIFMLIAGVDDFDMSIIKFIVIWLSLLGLSIALYIGGAKLSGVDCKNE